MVVNVLMIGSGEYTTGYVHGSATDSDKGAGVVALSMFDLRNQQLVDDITGMIQVIQLLQGVTHIERCYET